MQFANSAEMAEKAQTELDREGCVIDGKASPWVSVMANSIKSCVALSARLRISPQSRFDRLVAGTNTRPANAAHARAMARRNDDDPDSLLA